MPFRSNLSRPQARDIANRFVGFRRRQGLSQTDLAKLMGVCRATVANVELRYNRAFPSTYRKFLAVVEESKKPKREVKLQRNLNEIDWKEE